MRAFISYCHMDEHYLNRLKVHLAQLKRDGLDTFFDRDILAGDHLDDKIKFELEAADIFLLLISPDFIASNYCYEIEMQRALDRHTEGTARVVSILVEPCEWKAIDQLSALKALPKDGVPVSKWGNENDAFLDVTTELRRVVQNLSSETDKHDTRAPVENVPVHQQASLESKRKPKPRIPKDFNEIDKAKFVKESFEHVRSYFEINMDALSQVEGLDVHFDNFEASAFCCMIENKFKSNSTHSITVRRGGGSFSLGDIYYSFSKFAAENTSNGMFWVRDNRYELFFESTGFGFGVVSKNLTNELNAYQVAEEIWREYLNNAGIEYN